MRQLQRAGEEHLYTFSPLPFGSSWEELVLVSAGVPPLEPSKVTPATPQLFSTWLADVFLPGELTGLT